MTQTQNQTQTAHAMHGQTPTEAGKRFTGPARKPLPLWDRVKFLILLGGLWFLLVWALMAENPLIGFQDAWIERTQSARWLIALIVIEAIRQVHYLISEHWAAYHRFWTQRVFGSTERFVTRRFSAWTRFRLKRAAIWLFWIVVLAIVLGQIYDVSPAQGLFKAPAAFFKAAAVPRAGHRADVRRRAAVRRHLLVPVQGRRRDLLPGGHRDPVLRRLGPGPRARAGPGEHHLPGEPRGHRGEGRLRPGRHPALGSARHRQDPDGRGGRRRDGPALRLRRSRRVHQHVHGRRHPEGQGAVPQAAQARPALRRGHRLLRRGRCPGQPRRRLGRPGRRPARPRRRGTPATGSPTSRSRRRRRCSARPLLRRRRARHRGVDQQVGTASSWAAWVATAGTWARCRPC